MPQAPTDYTPDSFKVLLKKLVQTPNDFTPEDCALCFRHLCVQGASDAQVSGSWVGWSCFGSEVPLVSL
jgi:anthranilate phosphoribosyltransferase